jgi:hypothetical protein
MNYRKSRAVAELLTGLGIKHRFIRPHCPLLTG